MFPVPNFNLQLKNNKEQLVKEQLLILCKEMGEMRHTKLGFDLSYLALVFELIWPSHSFPLQFTCQFQGLALASNVMGWEEWLRTIPGFEPKPTVFLVSCFTNWAIWHSSDQYIPPPPPKWSSPLKITTPDLPPERSRPQALLLARVN